MTLNYNFYSNYQMLSKIFGFSLAVLAAAVDTDEVKQDLAQTQCTSVLTTSGTVFDLRGLEITDSFYAQTVGAEEV